ncbi:hypothetical protein [Roseiconus lacunae]|uniref:hypothetical protein n=1 Tax=Roseiconus lacunae TaxID=2605694 RepID=UPI001E4CE5FF|nr:hypothetical protein [Roseiconus lacunae]MCD0457889.1 hypothetical protein [Roseiconus lacunae]
MATDFTDLHLDADETRQIFDNVGIDSTAYTTGELESLGVVSNVVVLDAIDGAADDIQQSLAEYEIEVGILGGIQENLTNFQTKIGVDEANTTDAMDFLRESVVMIEISDTSMVDLDYTPDNGTYSISTTFTNLKDYLTALQDNSVVTTGGGQIVDIELRSAIVNGYASGLRTGTGTIQSTGYSVDDFLNGTSKLVIESDKGSATAELDIDQFREYLAVRALQKSGYINEDVVVEPLMFASAGSTGTHSEEYVEVNRMITGGFNVDLDLSADTLEVEFMSMAAFAQAGIDADNYWGTQWDGDPSTWTGSAEYFYDDLTFDLPDPGFAHSILAYIESVDSFHVSNGSSYNYTYRWSDLSEGDIGDIGMMQDDDRDLLVETVATAIESQSTSSEVALLTVNQAISEWGELNDVWDLIHEYIHDALKRSSDNSI